MRLLSWTGFRSILCPIDFSEQSRTALRYAEAIALRDGAVLTVLYVNDPLLVSAAAAALHDRDVVKRSASELEDFVTATIASPSKTRLRVKSRVSIGRPADAILKAAAGRADLLVLGTRGITGASRLLIGSTALSLLQRTNVPILAVPVGDDGPASALSRWPGERIAAALELDRASHVEVETAARVAQWFDASLMLLHVVSDIAAPAWLRGDWSAHDRSRVARAQQRMDRPAADVRHRVRTGSWVTCGRVADEIATFAKAEHVGLIITALRDRRGWFGARRGSVSYQVLSHAIAPVLAYPPRWRPGVRRRSLTTISARSR